MTNYKLITKINEIYENILRDINSAKESIYLETYIFANDSMGKKFEKILAKKAQEGIKIKMLLDEWGSATILRDFDELRKAGVEVIIFKKFPLISLHEYHKRNHRKILVIDERISYIGSSNINKDNLKWSEVALRIENNHLSKSLIKIFEEDTKQSKSIFFWRKRYRKDIIINKNLRFIRDVPSHLHTQVYNKYLKEIQKAKDEIIILTPYFLINKRMRDELIKANTRGVTIKIIIPKDSDINIINLYHEYEIEGFANTVIDFYLHKNFIHSKLFLADKKTFFIGSTNFDHRSFIHQYEIMLYGDNKDISKQINKYLEETISNSIIVKDKKKKSKVKAFLYFYTPSFFKKFL